MASHRFGFKPPSNMDRHDYQETTQLVSHKRKEVGGEAAKEATRNDRRRQDSSSGKMDTAYMDKSTS
jgi:hypothetical protein